MGSSPEGSNNDSLLNDLESSHWRGRSEGPLGANSVEKLYKMDFGNVRQKHTFCNTQ